MADNNTGGNQPAIRLWLKSQKTKKTFNLCALWDGQYGLSGRFEDRSNFENGVTITSIADDNFGGDGSILDTQVVLSSGDEIYLLDINGITDPNDLLA